MFLAAPFFALPQLKTDSLFKVWNDQSRPDTIRLQAMQRICAKGYLYSKPDTAFILANELYEFAIKKKLYSYAAFALQVMGSSCSIRADHARSIEYFTRSLKMAEEHNDFKNVSSALNNIGVIYYEQGQNGKAIEYYSRSLALSEKLNKKSGIALALGNLGSVYQSLGQNKKAIEMQTRCLKIAEEIKNKETYANAIHALGVNYSDIGELEKTIEYESKAIELYNEMNDFNSMAGAMAIMGSAYVKSNQSEKGVAILKNALDISKKGGLAITAREASQYLYLVYKKQGKTADALAMHEYYISMRDSIQNEKNQGRLLEQEMQYNYEKQKALDQKEQEKLLAVAEEQEQKQKVVTYSVFAGLMLVLLFALFVFNRLRITRKQKEVIETQKELVEQKQKEVIDSIKYAKRIQQSLLPSEKYIARNLQHLNKKP
ncbi:MAG: tetratricopeptide repeat protein [Bacteroidia bacterium]|nr:tetratricopeptide repeat protein [Bacteroidia bacterium]